MTDDRYKLSLIGEDEFSIVYRVPSEMIEKYGTVYYMRLFPEYDGLQGFSISLSYETQDAGINKLVLNYGMHFMQVIIRRSYDIEVENGLLYIPKELFKISAIYTDKNRNPYSKIDVEVYKSEKQIVLLPKTN